MPLRLSAIDRSRAAEVAGRACCVVLAVLVLWLLAHLVWALLPHGDAAFEHAPVRAGMADQAPTRSIANWHLFGNAPPQPAAGGAATSTLSLILRGTVADRDPKTGFAVIGTAGNGERAYRVGQEIVPGARLSGVYADRVVLLHGGAEETLKLPRETRLAPTEVMRPTPATASSRTRPGAASATDASGTDVNPALAGKAPTAWQQSLAHLRQNPDELLQRVRIEPVFDGARLGGVRLSAASDADAALMQQAGLRPGDVVTRVNGQPIDSLARGQQIVAGLGDAASARVTVTREGKPVELTIGLP